MRNKVTAKCGRRQGGGHPLSGSACAQEPSVPRELCLRHLGVMARDPVFPGLSVEARVQCFSNFQVRRTAGRAGPHPEFLILCLGLGLQMCFSITFPGDIDAANGGTTL